MGNWNLRLLPEKKFNKQTFDEYYTEYEQYLYTNKPVKYQIVAPLENFDCASNSSTIKLSNNVRIVPANSTFYPYIIENDRGRWINEGIDPEIMYYYSPEFFLEIDYEMEKEIVPSQRREHIEQEAKKELIKVMKILRLYKEGDIGCVLVYWYPKTPCAAPYTYDDILFYSGNYSKPNKYYLQEDDIKRLELLFKKYLRNSEKTKEFHTAIEYLNDGLTEGKFANKLRSLITALESLFVKEDERQKKGVIIANRTSSFIEKDRKKREKIYTDIMKAYFIRNNMEHGDRDKVDELECKEYTIKTERHVRQAIKNWLDEIEKGKTAQDIIDSIDGQVSK